MLRSSIKVRENSLVVHASARRGRSGKSPAPASSQPSPAELVSPQAAWAITELLSDGNFAGRAVAVTPPAHRSCKKSPPSRPCLRRGSRRQVVPSRGPQDLTRCDTPKRTSRVSSSPAKSAREPSSARKSSSWPWRCCADVDRFDARNNFIAPNWRRRVRSIVDEPCALYRTIDRFVRRREDEQEVHVLVDIGASAARRSSSAKAAEIELFKRHCRDGRRRFQSRCQPEARHPPR